jgi:two-component system OmpR family sensor kinase
MHGPSHAPHRSRHRGWAWADALQHGGFFAHYVKATLHRRIFFLLGAAIVTNGIVVTLLAHTFGLDVHQRTRAWLVVSVFICMLWGVSGRIARRLTRPFVELSRVAQEIGRGNLSARYKLGRHGRTGEAFMIGHSINEMAGRIEKQLKDQRELLAAVSHEVRTPLARIRMLVELARTHEAGADQDTARFVVDAKTLDDLDREVIEVDALVGELLASSRLDFAALTCAELDASDVVRRALERQSIDPASIKLALPETPCSFRADPTLVQRALANILQNAIVHAEGVDTVVVTESGEWVRFEVKDRGPGLVKGEEHKIFDPFYRGSLDTSATTSAHPAHAALGLGLALVQRIAKAHGGQAFAGARTDGQGACIGIELPRRPRDAVATTAD